MPTLVQGDDSDSDDDEEESDDEASSDNEYGHKNIMRDLPASGSQIDHGVRRSTRILNSTAFLAQELTNDTMCQAFDEFESAFQALDTAAELLDIPIGPYLPEPKSLADVKRLPLSIQKDWIKTVIKEFKGVIVDNSTFRRGEQPQIGDEVIPAMIIFKAKVTSRGLLDKLKARLVARGDFQHKSGDPDNLWSPCVFARTFKMFVVKAVQLN